MKCHNCGAEMTITTYSDINGRLYEVRYCFKCMIRIMIEKYPCENYEPVKEVPKIMDIWRQIQ